MSSKPFHFGLSGALALTAASALAGPVQVSYGETWRYADAGTTRFDEQRNLQALAAYLQSLGRQVLPADQTLKVEVVELDLAGFTRPTHRGDLRIVRGGADWPSITLRYTLQRDGPVLRQGEETVSDMNYTRRIHDPFSDQPLGAEKRMLNEWFRARFGPGQARTG